MHFGGVEALLADVHGIASDRRTAFQARLKNFLRLGLLDDVKAGRGKAAKYEIHHILTLAVALEFAQLGMTPERIVTRLSIPGAFATDFERTLADYRAGADDVLYLFAESTLVVSRADNPAAKTLDRSTGRTLRISEFEVLTEPNGFLNSNTRVAAINLSRLLRQVASYIERSNLGTIEQIETDIRGWAATVHSELEALAQMDAHGNPQA